ncbi:MAG: GntR family transcriptional regulator [Nostocaceae cyanobacterium]|nr:GntR family transcriptional regulator [Nostocaceae cyanobacterium]
MVMPALGFLPIIVDSSAPITINAQIAEQIKLLIVMGELQSGQALPTTTQLAKHLGVNHNTIASVYNDLISSNYLVAQRGKGTFVAQTQAVQQILNHKHFYNLLSEAFTAAKHVGLSPSEFGAAAYGQAVMMNRKQATPLKLVFVEGLQYEADVYEAIKSEIKQHISVLSLEDLKASQPKALEELFAADLIMTRGQHLWEVTQIAQSEQEVIKVDIKPSRQLLTQIFSLPRNALMLLVDQSKGGSEVIKEMLTQVGIFHIKSQTLDLEYLQQNLQLLQQADVVCVSRLVEDYVRQCSPQPDKVIVFNFDLDETNMLVIKARLAAIQLALATT